MRRRLLGALSATAFALALCPAFAVAQDIPQDTMQEQQETLREAALEAQSQLFGSTDLDDGYFIKLGGKDVLADDYGRFYVDEGGTIAAPTISVYYFSADEEEDADGHVTLSESKYTKQLEFQNDDFEWEPVSGRLAVGTYRVTVTAKSGSGLTGSTYSYLTVYDRHDFEGSAVAFEGYNEPGIRIIPAGKTPKLVVSIDGKTVASSSYSVEYFDYDTDLSYGTAMPDEAGEYYAIVTGKNPYYGEQWLIFRVAYDLTKADITGVSSKTYTGKAIKPIPDVEYDGITYIEDEDYIVSYKNNTKVGTATVTITGTGRLIGTVTKTFTISKAKVSSTKISGLSKKTYTGKALKPAPTVKLGSVTLKKGTDYTVAYKNNTKAGTATVTITGKGNLTGSVTKKFTIAKAVISKAKFSKVKAQKYKKGKAVKPSVTVKFGGKKLKKGADYTVTYKNNKKKGTASIVVKGKGNFSGSKTIKFKIK